VDPVFLSSSALYDTDLMDEYLVHQGYRYYGQQLSNFTAKCAPPSCGAHYTEAGGLSTAIRPTLHVLILVLGASVCAFTLKVSRAGISDHGSSACSQGPSGEDEVNDFGAPFGFFHEPIAGQDDGKGLHSSTFRLNVSTICGILCACGWGQ